MTGSHQLRRRPTTMAGIASLAAIALVTALAACGHDGTATVTFPPTPRQVEPVVRGVVQMPAGRFAAQPDWWKWASDQLFGAPAYAIKNPNVSPVGAGALVSVSFIDELDAGDGSIDTPRLIKQEFTDDNGAYTIIDSALEDTDACRLMVAVGGGEQLTRSFVLSHNTNPDQSLDAISEATVRIVLDRLTQAPAVQLCDFTTDDLVKIYNAVSAAAFPANGTTTAAMNNDAYQRAARNRDVAQAIANTVGAPVL